MFKIIFLGILRSIQKCEFIILLIILKDVLNIINIPSNKLQNKTVTLGQSQNVIMSVIKSFDGLRKYEEFYLV